MRNEKEITKIYEDTDTVIVLATEDKHDCLAMVKGTSRDLGNLLASSFRNNEKFYDVVLSAVFGYADQERHQGDDKIGHKVDKCITRWEDNADEDSSDPHSIDLDEDPQSVVNKLKSVLQEVEDFHNSIEKED